MDAILRPDQDPSSVAEKAGFGLRVGGPHLSVQDLFSLSGRTFAGALGSIGANIAMAILESGGDVVCFDKPEDPPLGEPLNTLLDIAHDHEARVRYYTCDVSNPASVRTAFKALASVARYPLRGLVHCAGIAYNASALEHDMDRSREVLDVNVNGSLACAREAARMMGRMGAKSGSIVLVGSMSGHGANKGLDTASYNASKAAVVQLARSLAAEWGLRKDVPQIRVNTLSPGYVKTSLTANDMLVPGREKSWSEQNMLGRLSYPDEYRGPAVFLLSDASGFVTGADLRVDGGHTAW